MTTPSATHDASLPDDMVLLKALIVELRATLREVTRDRDGILHRFEQFLKRLYGPKSERFHPDQLSLFPDEGPTEEGPPEDEWQPSPSSSRRCRGRHGRRALPGHLPRRRVEHD